MQSEAGLRFRLTKSEAEFLAVKLAMLLQEDTRLRGQNRATLQKLIDQIADPPEERAPRRTYSDAKCGPVHHITNMGVVTTSSALTPAAVRKIAPERITIGPDMRARILHRDRGTCRYCQTTVGPFEIDHVIPVAQGGATRLWNLVTACRDCNQRKGNRIWRPIHLSVIRSQAG